MATRPLYSATFWLDAFERLVKTIAQSTLAVVASVNLSDTLDDAFNPKLAILTVGLAGAASLLTSIISSGIGEPGTASVLNPAPPDTLKDNGQALIYNILIAAAVAVLVFAILVAVSDSLTF
jgi:hypothetical protein